MIKSRKFILALVCLIITLLVCDDANASTWGTLLGSGSSDKTVFSGMAEKTTAFAVGLRTFAYAISGFGIIMFTFLAICGKINFKHLGYIVMSLFFLSGVGAMIDYTTNQKKLSYEFKDTYVAAGKSVGEMTVRHSSL